VDYGRVTPFLTKAIQEQQVEIDALKAENVRLQAVEAENARLKGQTDKLAAKMEALEKTMAAKQTKHRGPSTASPFGLHAGFDPKSHKADCTYSERIFR
jgi:hypothetical protein